VPILAREEDLFPRNLLDTNLRADRDDVGWWAFYTRSRREKEMMRRLRGMNIAFYGPLVPKRNRSPSGRVRTSYMPLFPNYVFVHGDDSSRSAAMTTNCASNHVRVPDGVELTRELRQIFQLIERGISLTPETRLQPGTRVRVRSGALRGQEGVIVSRHVQTRLVVTVNFLQQGASVLLEDFEVEAID